jgi:hypothetical protein
LTLPDSTIADANVESHDMDEDEEPLTIPEAKRRLAMSLGVSEDDIKITITS